MSFRGWFDLPHGDLVLPDVLGLLRDEIGDFGSHVARGDGVGTGELNPLDGQRTNCSTNQYNASIHTIIRLAYPSG